MKKRTLIISLIIALTAIISSSTIAYYSASEKAINVITTGGVSIELNEYGEGGKAFEDIENALPGDTYVKQVEIENTAENPVWVRANVEIGIELQDPEAKPEEGAVILDFDTANWTLGDDGYYYYNSALNASETTLPVFSHVTLSKDMDNRYQDCTIHVIVAAQAVQTANNGSSALTAAGWPAFEDEKGAEE